MQCISIEGAKIFRGFCGNCKSEFQKHEHEMKRWETTGDGKVQAVEPCPKCVVGVVTMIQLWGDE